VDDISHLTPFAALLSGLIIGIVIGVTIAMRENNRRG
jgi:uncharacterized membrane-anchored protein YhcB (DUF1043 family)